MSLRHDLQSLARELEAEDNAAFDLWTWLPSYKAAVASHGDYASEHTPSASDVMKEAAVLLSVLRPVDRGVEDFVVVGSDGFKVFGRGKNYDSALNDGLKAGVTASRVLVVPERRLSEMREWFRCPCGECERAFPPEEEKDR